MKNIIRFFYALRIFWKALRRYRRWDYTYYLQFLRDGIEDQAKFLRDKGNEVPEDRLPKVQKMMETVYMLDEIIEGGEEEEFCWENVWITIMENMKRWWD